MVDTVLFLYGGGYEKNISDAAKLDKNTCVFRPFKSKLIAKLFQTHNAYRLNKKIGLPFRRIWFRRCLNDKKLEISDDVCFVFYESFPMSYSRKFLSYLKKKFPNCKCCFIFLNPVEHANMYCYKKYTTVAQYYDAALAVSERDAEEYGFRYYSGTIYMPRPVSDKSIRSDVFFVGMNKGRLHKLLEIYQTLTQADLKCDFYINDVEKDEMRFADDIKYNCPISYEEVIDHVAHTKCVLEVLQNDDDYFSLRTIEAYVYKKKLLTTNKTIVNRDFYDSRIVSIINDPKEIDIDFVKAPIIESAYGNVNFWSFDHFKKFLKEVVNGRNA